MRAAGTNTRYDARTRPDMVTERPALGLNRFRPNLTVVRGWTTSPAGGREPSLSARIRSQSFLTIDGHLTVDGRAQSKSAISRTPALVRLCRYTPEVLPGHWEEAAEYDQTRTCASVRAGDDRPTRPLIVPVWHSSGIVLLLEPRHFQERIAGRGSAIDGRQPLRRFD